MITIQTLLAVDRKYSAGDLVERIKEYEWAGWHLHCLLNTGNQSLILFDKQVTNYDNLV